MIGPDLREQLEKVRAAIADGTLGQEAVFLVGNGSPLPTGTIQALPYVLDAPCRAELPASGLGTRRKRKGRGRHRGNRWAGPTARGPAGK